MLTDIAKNGLFLSGLAIISWGLGLAYKPLGLVAAGASLVWVSMLLSAEKE